mmetsp:Transcript_73372/g.129461  ORF Transcript_73372/g.129461 Transcript_73372/m.129461 type:complete len:190 (-) Transcript_73372:10-579(-)
MGQCFTCCGWLCKSTTKAALVLANPMDGEARWTEKCCFWLVIITALGLLGVGVFFLVTGVQKGIDLQDWNWSSESAGTLISVIGCSMVLGSLLCCCIPVCFALCRSTRQSQMKQILQQEGGQVKRCLMYKACCCCATCGQCISHVCFPTRRDSTKDGKNQPYTPRVDPFAQNPLPNQVQHVNSTLRPQV